MPFAEFWAFYECIDGIAAAERLDQFRAITNALGCAFAEKGAPLLESVQDDLVRAYLAAPKRPGR